MDIVKTQLIPPRLKKNVLRRERLVKILKDNLDKKLILVIGGAGYGKTTLLAQFIDELNKPFLFYTINKTDNNLPVFLTYLITGIKNIYKHFGIRTNSLISGMTSMDDNLEVLLGAFINELVENVDKELFIILDDYHLIEGTEIINIGLDYLLDRIPFNVHFIISSRTELPLSIAKIRAKGDLLEITDKELKFTSKEIRMGIEHCFEGWITGLQLMSYLLLPSAFS